MAQKRAAENGASKERKYEYLRGPVVSGHPAQTATWLRSAAPEESSLGGWLAPSFHMLKVDARHGLLRIVGSAVMLHHPS